MPKTTPLLRSRQTNKTNVSIAKSYSPWIINCYSPCKNQGGGWHGSERTIEFCVPRVSSQRKK
jgi:hypothetical protein